MATYSIIGGDGKQYGPINADEMRKWIAEGRLNAQSLVKAESDAEFRTLSTFPEFADAFGTQSAMPDVPPPIAGSADWAQRDYDLDIGDCIRRGWEMVKNNFWPIVGVNALVLIVMVVINQIFGAFTGPAINNMVVRHQFSSVAIFEVILTTVISAPIYAVLTAGLYKYYLKMIRGENAGIADAFSGFGPMTGQLILAGLVVNILSMIGYIFCLLPGIYLVIAWSFSIPLIIDRRMNFWDAMELSRKLVSKHWFLVFGFLLVSGLVAAAGVLACCIGIFVTMPISFAAIMYAYETIFSKDAHIR
jgi:uncharacterized membrane protein